jgi:hypothetical protein
MALASVQSQDRSGIPPVKVTGPSCARVSGSQTSQSSWVSISNRADVRAFLTAASIDPSQASSIREKALKWPAVSRMAMDVAIPISAALEATGFTRMSAWHDVTVTAVLQP